MYRLFISHSWTHGVQYSRLINLLDARPYFKFHDYSVPRDDPIHNAANDRELYWAIYRQMLLCHVVLVLAGVYATYSRWIDKEIRIASREFTTPKPIIGIKPWGHVNVSSTVSRHALEIVGWNTNSVVEAIRRWAL